MKTPQLEDGFTRIANELFEAILAFGFTEREYGVVFAILRKTYGYGKKEDDMSAQQIGDMIGKHRNHVTVAINGLVAKGVLTKRQGHYGMILGINKDHKSWGKTSTEAVLDKDTGSTESVLGNVVQLVPNRLRTSTESVLEVVPNQYTQKKTSKETKQKKARSRKSLGTSFATWIEKTKAEGIKPIPEDHAVFKYAAKIKLPDDFLRLCWLEFRREHAEREDKVQRDWAATFHVYVRKNYYKLWFKGKQTNQWELTTAGVQLQEEMRESK